MSDQVYDNLPKDLVAIIAHQEIRNELLKSLSYDIFSAMESPKIDEPTKQNLRAKCHSLLEEWIASKSPKILSSISHGEIAMRATKTIDDFIKHGKTSIAATLIKLNDVSYEFQLEMEKKYAK